MANSTLTRDAIVSSALRRIGNETITTDAIVWLLNFVDDLYTNYKWPFAEKTTTGSITAGQTSVALPTDFGDLYDKQSLRIIDSAGTSHPLSPWTPNELDVQADPDAIGQPFRAIFDLNGKTWRPYPLPNQSFTYNLRYRVKPARVASDVVIPFPNDEILIQGVFVKALQYEDDERFKDKLALLEIMIRKLLRGFNMSPIKATGTRYNPLRFLTPVIYR
jgi:hypothetical protein